MDYAGNVVHFRLCRLAKELNLDLNVIKQRFVRKEKATSSEQLDSDLILLRDARAAYRAHLDELKTKK